MRAVLLIFVALFFLGPASAAASEYIEPKNRLFAAETFFYEALDRNAVVPARKSFQRAAARYESLLDEGFTDPDLYLNCGNAYLLADDLPKAILVYRRG